MLFSRIKQLSSWRPGQLVRNTTHAGGWNVVRAALQAACLILMARIFGADGYGALVGTIALYITFAQFAGLGSGIALVRHLARAGTLHAQLSATQRAYLVTSVVLFGLAWPFSAMVLGTTLDRTTLAILAIAEIVVAPMLGPLIYRYQAEERMFIFGALQTFIPLARFTAILLAPIFKIRNVDDFAPLYLTCLVIVVLVSLSIFSPRGQGNQQRPSLVATIRGGFPYVISSVAVTAGSELDKTILLHSAGGVIAGQYAAAYRIMQAATLPVNSLILAVTPRLFRAQHGTFAGKTTRILISATLIYAFLTSILMWLIAPLIPWLLGRGFAHSIGLLRLMCTLLITTCLRQMLVAQLTAFDMQKFRNFVECIAVMFAIAAMLVTIPIYGPIGAIGTALACDMAVIASVLLHMHLVKIKLLAKINH